MKTLKLILGNLVILFSLLLLTEITLRFLHPDYQYYYRTHLGQPDLDEILAKTDTNWLSPEKTLGWVCQQKADLIFPTPPTDSVRYRINEQGFRNSFDFNDSISVNKKRILLLGDSFMFGIYLPEDKTITAHLQKEKGEEYIFYNIAVPAWGLDQMYLAYHKYIEQIKPDQVVLAFVDEDLTRSLEILFHGCGRKPSFKIENNQLVENRDDPHWWEYLCWNNQIGNRLLQIYYNRKAANLARFMLADIIKKEKEAGRQASFIRIPALVDLEQKEPRKAFDFNAFMNSHETPYLQLYDSIIVMSNQEYRELYIPDDGHPTAKGAKFLFEHIKSLVD